METFRKYLYLKMRLVCARNYNSFRTLQNVRRFYVWPTGIFKISRRGLEWQLQSLILILTVGRLQ